MVIKKKRGWEIKESEVTPESKYLNRRNLIIGGGVAVAAGAVGAYSILGNGPMTALPAAAAGADPTADLYPAMKNAMFLDGGRPVTGEPITTTYNNFYELGEDKGVSRSAGSLKTRPWTIKIQGMVDKPMTLGIDDLIRKLPLEERIYRHRCVEAWSYVVPWTGFSLAKLVELAKPASGATYLRMETLLDPRQFPGENAFYYPWPYVEGLTMAEATNDLAFLVMGAYGKPVANVMGAPLRLHLPWKYGFKSIKSIVVFEFTNKRPDTFWALTGPSEYGFWANVNPGVPHPRWSQQMERDLGTGNLIPTKLYNGYADQVAAIYTGLQKTEKLYM